MPRFFRPPPWRFVVTDLSTTTLTFLDGLCWDATLEIDLHAPMKLSGRVPSANPEINILHTDDHPFLSEGDRLLYAFRRDERFTAPWTIVAAGPILDVRDSGLPGAAMSEFTMLDPWALMYRMPVVDENGDLPGELGLKFLDGQGPGGANWQWGTIALTILKWAEDHYGSTRIDAGDGSRIGEGVTYQDWSGTAFYEQFLAETDETEYEIQRGKTVGQVWDDLVASDKLDITLFPIYDPANRPGYTSEISILAQPAVVGQPHNKERADAIFTWDLTLGTLSALERRIHGQQRANQITFYTRHGVVDSFKEDVASILRYGTYGYEQAFPDMTLDTDQIARWAEGQLKMRAYGIREVIPIPSPQQPPLYWLEYQVGDFVPVYASERFRERIPDDSLGSGALHRVYGVTFEINRPDFNEKMTEIRVSPDGIPG